MDYFMTKLRLQEIHESFKKSGNRELRDLVRILREFLQ